MIASAPAPAGDTAVLDAFLEHFFLWEPVTATFAGVHEHDHRLPDWSPDGLARSRDERMRLQRDLARAGMTTLPADALVRRDWMAIDGALASACLEIQLAEDASTHFIRGNPALAVGEAVFSLVALAGDVHRPPALRIEAARARLEAIPGFLRGVQRSLADRAIPASWKERCLRECDGGQALIEDLGTWLVSDDAALRARSALAEFKASVAACRTAPDANGAAGEEVLQLIIRRGHWCELDLDQLRHEAREGMAREGHRLRDMLRGDSWVDVAERIAADHPDAGHVLESCEETWNEARAIAASQVTWPGVAVQYLAMPSWARRAAPSLYYLMYRSPAPMEHPSADRYAVPLPLPDAGGEAVAAFCRTWNRGAIKLNHVAHHGGLGHHVQNWHAARSLSRVSRIAAVDGASRIAMVAGGTMAEGWACYAAEVMEQLGWLTPDEQISEQHTRLRLMVRAVADLELHSGRLSFDDAVRLHIDVAGATASVARSEVTKCAMFPGTASMYWLGLRELWRLRRDEEAAKGSTFDVRAFHDTVLSCGSMPVALVARLFAAARRA